MVREILVRRALRLEWFTAGWMVLEAAVALYAARAAHSLTLLAFGADSFIELLSALLLLWRLNVELVRGMAYSRSAEERARRLGGALLFALAVYVLAQAGWGLWQREGQARSLAGLCLAAVAIPVMYGLARTKGRIAEQIGSRALRADAMQSITCGYLSMVVLVGLAAQWLFDFWWLDALSALALVPLLVHEAREAWEGEECTDCGHDNRRSDAA